MRGVNKQTDASSNDSCALAVCPEDGYKSTYSASYKAIGGVAGDIFTLGGSATKVVRLVRLEISGNSTTAGYLDFSLEKRSTAGTPGTLVTAATISPYDSATGAATGTVSAYSAAGTPGTSLGILRTAKMALVASGTVIVPDEVVWEFGVTPAQCPTLRAVAEKLTIVSSATFTTCSIDISCTWTEE